MAQALKQKRKQAARAASTPAAQKERDELELLMLDPAQRNGGGADDGFSLKQLVRANDDGRAAKRRKRGGDAPADDFELDTRDTRFAALLESPAFAIDPTAPQFHVRAQQRAATRALTLHRPPKR